MNCNTLRKRLVRGAPGPAEAGVGAHLESCAACSSFARRLQETRRDLRRHHAGIQPDAAFAARVGSRLDGGAPEILGRTALRLLPLSAALLLLLLWISAGTPARQTVLSSEETEQAYINWVLQGAEQENS